MPFRWATPNCMAEPVSDTAAPILAIGPLEVPMPCGPERRYLAAAPVEGATTVLEAAGSVVLGVQPAANNARPANTPRRGAARHERSIPNSHCMQLRGT